MPVIMISILGRISGNVNADEVIGQRITIKKMYSNTGETLPFVSARAVKRAIRQAFMEMGFEIDPFEAGKAEALELSDSGRPDKYIDNDLFGYMVTSGQQAFRRQAPIAMSYFKAVRDTPIKAEFGARFPRTDDPSQNPVPFEVEVADFIGRLCTIIYDYIGDFKSERKNQKNDSIETDELPLNEKVNRLKAFLDILLTPRYVLPRRTNSLSIPDYIAALVAFSKRGPLPICNYLDIDDKGNVDTKALERLKELKDRYGADLEIYLIDYKGVVTPPEFIEKATVQQIVENLSRKLFTS